MFEIKTSHRTFSVEAHGFIGAAAAAKKLIVKGETILSIARSAECFPYIITEIAA